MRQHTEEAVVVGAIGLFLLCCYMAWKMLQVTILELNRLHTMHQGSPIGRRITTVSLCWLGLSTVLAILAAVTQLQQPFLVIGATATCAWLITLELIDRQDPSHLALPGPLLAPWRGQKP